MRFPPERGAARQDPGLAPEPARDSLRDRLLPPAALTALFLALVWLLPVRFEVPINDDWATYQMVEHWRDAGRLR
jgi:hypothetical protein